jgi:dethiobiotin synthetase
VIIYVVGTGTEIGKTWLSAAIGRTLIGRGLKVSYRKYAESFGPRDIRDSQILSEVSKEAPEVITKFSYPIALAPPMAAVELGENPFALREMIKDLRFDQVADVSILEAAGGLRSPQAIDGDCLDVIKHLGPDLIVLVARSGLGAIHEVRSTAAFINSEKLFVFLNYFSNDDLVCRLNKAWLEKNTSLKIFTDIFEISEKISECL